MGPLICNVDKYDSFNRIYCANFENLLCKCYIYESFDTHYYYAVKNACQVYPDITSFSVILRPYRYIGSFDITIARCNDIILLLPRPIVISGSQSSLGKNLKALSLQTLVQVFFPKNFFFCIFLPC